VEWGETLLHWADEPDLCTQLAAVAQDPSSRLKLADLQARARAEGRIRSRRSEGKKGGATSWRRQCRDCRAPFPEADLVEGVCPDCRLPLAPAPFVIPRQEAEAWAQSRTDRRERERDARAIMERLVLSLAAVPAGQDCRRLALLAHEALVRVPPKLLPGLLEGYDLAHLAPLIDPFSWGQDETAWEALAALDPEALLRLAADALLLRDLERFEELGEEPRRARWYAGEER
jgi:hypothetical protein